ncbi:DUF3300 domain-containing protein [Fulvimonas sp. R45]|uniref:DUF3300 domain-containing protein n=1 Tax=Fulvimonas sp. R45 TaxID=3045937 RepID=UPI00265EB338|nr:DUF3300 domain-containing protein [Fulvimonas sp. R45]MDO1530595.1 DUF3300 domain-containing protein [Fulvimonas sp. R45]
MIDKTPTRRKAAYALLCAGGVMLAGCNHPPTPQAANPGAAGTAPAPAATAAQPSAPYTPPSADQLYQMVAPIALFPDKLVAQVLAGSTYPDQIAAADDMLQQHPDLKGALLADAVDPQPWDASVKGLTQFPSVLDQMARNMQWTTALGSAYVNDPADVMNAIQVMRERAASKGSLRSSPQMRVVSQAAPADEAVGDQGEPPPEYAGPAVVPAPQQTIEIVPAQPDTVYVPQYDPETVYGEPVATYPGYTYVEPRRYSTGEMVAAGAIGFGVGVVVGALLEHHHDERNSNPGWGWNSWGMHWGGARGGGNWQRPAVVHNNTVYVSRSTTIINRYTNINNSRTVNYVNSGNRTATNVNSDNRVVDNSVHDTRNARIDNSRHVTVARAPGETTARPAAQPMTMPHFGTPVRGARPAPGTVAHVAPEHPQAPRSLQGAGPPHPSMVRRPLPAPATRAPAAGHHPTTAHVVPAVAAHREAPRESAPPRLRLEAAHEAPRPEAARPAAPRPVERPASQVQPRPEPRAAPHTNPRPAASGQHDSGKPHGDDKRRKEEQQD